ncbi:aminodeoxychorismate lyase [soil metagenome]
MPSDENIIWLNGRLRPAVEAGVFPLDRGFTLGDGVFETLRAYGGIPFASTRHWQRLAQACETTGLPVPTCDEFTHVLSATLAANDLLEARVRFTVTRGSDPEGHSPTVVCSATPAITFAATERVATAPWTRNENGALAGVKSLSYAENVMAIAHAKRESAGEALFFNTRGELCEGATTNIFIVKDTNVFTPPLSSGCLAGVTRELVIELCRDHQISISEIPLSSRELMDADEAFLTSSTRAVQPISHINGIPFSSCSSPIGERIGGLFRSILHQNYTL